jgi:O-antigen ligase
MDPTFAATSCFALVLALLVLEHRTHAEVSLATWVPTGWLLIAGSRPLRLWFRASDVPVEQSMEAGSPLDRLVLSTLILVGLAVIVRRGIRWRLMTRGNAWLLVLFLYMAASIGWSEFPMVSFKRWVRTLGPVIMAVVLSSESRPLEAVQAVFRRTAYVLLPFSLMLVKYYPSFGVEFNAFTGQRMWTGVTTQKNSLGQVCAVSVLLMLWMTLVSGGSERSRRTRVEAIANLFIVCIAIFLLRGPTGSHSATSLAILAIGGITLLTLYRRETVRRFVVRHLTVVIGTAVVAFWLTADFVIGPVASALGRDDTLTGRREIWVALLGIAAKSPVIGVGYGGFWGLRPDITAQLQVNQSHNGYLGVYLELGAVGLALVATFTIALCRLVRLLFEHNRDLSMLTSCCLIVTLLYNVAESAFLSGGFLWTTMIIIAVMSSYFAMVESQRAPDCTPDLPFRECHRATPVATDCHVRERNSSKWVRTERRR